MTRSSADEARQRELARRYFLIGQCGFLVAVVICVLLLPQGLTANFGFSYYGAHARTVVPYRLAFICSGIGTLLSAWSLPAYGPWRVLKIAFLVMLLPLLGIVLTTGSPSRLISHIHVDIGTMLFVGQGVLACWLALVIRATPRNWALLILLFVCGVVSLLSLFGSIPYLIEGQILFQLTFSVLVAYTLGA